VSSFIIDSSRDQFPDIFFTIGAPVVNAAIEYRLIWACPRGGLFPVCNVKCWNPDVSLGAPGLRKIGTWCKAFSRKNAMEHERYT
jgi:hypothetical protein